MPSLRISRSKRTQLAVLGSRVLVIAWLSSAGLLGTVPSSIRGVSLTPICETLTCSSILLLSVPVDSSLSSSTSDSESSLSSSTWSPVEENECGNDRESSMPPPSEERWDV